MHLCWRQTLRAGHKAFCIHAGDKPSAYMLEMSCFLHTAGNGFIGYMDTNLSQNLALESNFFSGHTKRQTFLCTYLRQTLL